MKKNMVYITWTLRAIISFLFLLSAVAKMYPLWSFEKQLVDLGIATWCQSHYWARLLIALELAIGVAILFPHYLKSIVIPGTIVLLALFCAHLGIEIYKHGPNGNCGCFGQLIPMTPVEAIIKNIITIGILIFLFTKVSDKEKGQNRIIYPVAIFLASAFAMFMFFPFTPCINPKTVPSESAMNPVVTDTFQNETVSLNTLNEGSKILLEKNDTLTTKSKKDTATTTNKTVSATKTIADIPAKGTSRFSEFTTIGGVATNVNTGKKVICMFAAGCDHCRATAKELGQLGKAGKIPDVYILFMNEEADLIPAFFKEAEVKFPYTVLEIPKFWEVLGPDATTPGVFYLKDGKIIKSYVGIAEQKFNAEDFKKIIQ